MELLIEKIKKYFLYLTIFITGAVILIIEILGTRILSPFYGSTVFVWSSLITITLFSLALGYFIGGKLADKKPKIYFLSWFLFLAGIFILLIPKIDNFVLVITESYGLKSGPLISSFLLFAIPLFLLAMIDPFAIKITSRTLDTLGMSAGKIYGITTAGSLAGSLLAGFYLIPNFSVSKIFNMIGILLIVIFFIWQIINFKKKPKTVFALIFALILARTIFLVPDYVISSGYQDRVLFQDQSFYGDIKIIKAGPYKCLYVNAAGQSCVDENKTSDSSYIKQLAQIISQTTPKEILLMGMGAGTVLSVLPDDSQIDVVELDPKIVEIAKKYDLIPDKKYQIFYDDARHFIRKTNKEYDLVIMDLAIGDSLPFYMLTKESFEQIKKIIKEQGTFFVHVSLFPKTEKDSFLLSLTKTLNSVFGETHIISNDSGKLRNINFLASEKNIKFDNFYKFKGQNLGKAVLATDDYNPLEGYFLSHVLDFRQGEKTLGYEVYFAK